MAFTIKQEELPPWVKDKLMAICQQFDGVRCSEAISVLTYAIALMMRGAKEEGRQPPCPHDVFEYMKQTLSYLCDDMLCDECKAALEKGSIN